MKFNGKFFVSAAAGALLLASGGCCITGKCPLKETKCQVQKEDVKLLLPEKIYAVPGVETNVYFENIVRVINPDNYIFEARAPKGRWDEKRWSFTPTDKDTGSFTLTINVIGNEGLLASKKVTVVVSPRNAGAGKNLSVLVIGDSLTSGYGILTDGSATDGGAPIYKDATKTFAFLSAEAIKADCSLVSCTGIGVVRGFRTFPMADFYPKVSYFRDQNAEVSLADSGPIPDAVVINLSTNDQSKQVPPAEFEPAAKALIEQIQSIRGKNVPIIWVLNANVTSLNPTIQKVMEAFGGEDASFYTVEIKLDSLGGGGHPSEASQAEEAQKLAKFFKNKLHF